MNNVLLNNPQSRKKISFMFKKTNLKFYGPQLKPILNKKMKLRAFGLLHRDQSPNLHLIFLIINNSMISQILKGLQLEIN